MTGSVCVDVATIRGPGGGVADRLSSCRGVPLRAVSAAKGDIKFERGASGFELAATGWGAIEGREIGLGAEPLPEAVALDTSLNNCSMGNKLLRVGHFQEAKFQVETLFLLVAQFAVRAQHDLEMTREIFFAEQFRDTAYALALFAGNLQQRRLFAGDFCDRGVAQKTNHLAREVGRAVAFADEVVDLPQNFLAVAL